MDDTEVPKYETTAQLEARTGIPIHTWRNWRRRGMGPAYIEVGPKVIRYRTADVDAWLTSRLRQPTRPAKGE